MIIFDGSISATISVRGRSYTLAGSANLQSTPGSGGTPGPTTPAGVPLPTVNLVYHAPFGEALSLGTLESTVSGAQDLIDDIVAALNLPGGFKAEWTDFQTRLKSLPAPLGEAYQRVLSQVELRITDIGLSLEAPADGGPYKRGGVTLGFGFDCSQSATKLLGIKLQAIGVKFSVGILVP